jgi:hypothetical protein
MEHTTHTHTFVFVPGCSYMRTWIHDAHIRLYSFLGCIHAHMHTRPTHTFVFVPGCSYMWTWIHDIHIGLYSFLGCIHATTHTHTQILVLIPSCSYMRTRIHDTCIQRFFVPQFSYTHMNARLGKPLWDLLCPWTNATIICQSLSLPALLDLVTTRQRDCCLWCSLLYFTCTCITCIVYMHAWILSEHSQFCACFLWSQQIKQSLCMLAALDLASFWKRASLQRLQLCFTRVYIAHACMSRWRLHFVFAGTHTRIFVFIPWFSHMHTWIHDAHIVSDFHTCTHE